MENCMNFGNLDFGFNSNFKYNTMNKSYSRKSSFENIQQNNSTLLKNNPIPKTSKIYLSGDKRNSNQFHNNSQHNIHTYSKTNTQSILPLMEKLQGNNHEGDGIIQSASNSHRQLQFKINNQQMYNSQQVSNRQLQLQNQSQTTDINMNGYESKIQTPSTLNELISLVPIQQRPNRNLSLTHSAKKLELKKDFRKIVKPDMNLSSAPVPPKPPQRRDIKLNENEFIQALQNQIFELKSKVLDFEMRKKTELKDGIQKDENFYSNLSDLNSYELKNFLINQIYEIKESKKQFYESSQKIKQLLHDLQTGRDFTQLREQLSTFLDNKQTCNFQVKFKLIKNKYLVYSQMNFELLYIDTKRELDKMNLQFAHLKHKTEQLDQQAKSNSHLSKEFKLKLQRQTDLNSKQHKTILTQNKINSEKSLKVESLLHSIFTLTQEEEIVKNSKFKEEIVLKRTINFLLRENFELKKQCRIKDSYLESAQIEINRLKTKVNRLMLKIEEDNNINKNVNGNIVVATNQTKYKFSAQQSAKIINLQPLNRIQNDITHILQSQKSLIDGQVSLNHLNQRYQDNNLNPLQIIINKQFLIEFQEIDLNFLFLRSHMQLFKYQMYLLK